MLSAKILSVSARTYEQEMLKGGGGGGLGILGFLGQQGGRSTIAKTEKSCERSCEELCDLC